MIKYFIFTAFLSLSITGFASSFAMPNDPPCSFNQKAEIDVHPYLSYGIGTIALEIQAGILRQSDYHGLDFRIGAGIAPFTFSSAMGGHINYLRFQDVWNIRDVYVGAGAGIQYRQGGLLSDVRKNGVYVGPNVVLGRKFTNRNGRIQVHDINFLFPVNRKKGDWCIPTLSIGWLF